MLRADPGALKDYVDRAHECGSAAGISHVNIHVANAIAGIFVACGQDLADLANSCTAQTTLGLEPDGSLIVETVLYNLNVASVGGGTSLPTQRECLEIMGCYGPGRADALGEIIAATAMAGELPTVAAILNGRHTAVHDRYGYGH